MAGLCDPPGALGRLRQRLQDARSALHGVGDLGVQAAVGQGPGLRGLPGAAVLLARRNPAVQPRTADGRRRLPEPAGPGPHGGIQGGRRWRTWPGAHLLVWTTTPWTLPSNLAVAVNPDVTYVQVQGRRAPRSCWPRPRLAAYARELRRRARSAGHLPRRRPAGHAVPAAVPVFHGLAQRVSGAAGRLRDHRGRHRDRAHGAGLRRGRHGDRRQGRHRAGHPGRFQGPFRRHRPGLPGAARLRRQPADHPRPEEPAAVRPRRTVRC